MNRKKKPLSFWMKKAGVCCVTGRGTVWFPREGAGGADACTGRPVCFFRDAARGTAGSCRGGGGRHRSVQKFPAQKSPASQRKRGLAGRSAGDSRGVFLRGSAPGFSRMGKGGPRAASRGRGRQDFWGVRRYAWGISRISMASMGRAWPVVPAV